ncbi:hypothetical protein [Xenorhabdus bovienii]|nr:hypothetical protein [Xenorhabdus bovienii]
MAESNAFPTSWIWGSSMIDSCEPLIGTTVSRSFGMTASQPRA